MAVLSDLDWRRQGGLVASLFARALEVVAKFGLYALTLRLLGEAGSGEFFLCLSVGQLIGVATRLGLERPLLQQVAAERAVGRTRQARTIALQGLGAILAASTLAALALAACAPFIAEWLLHQPGLAGGLLIAAALAPAQNLAFGLAYVLMGLEKPAAGQLVMNALAPLAALACLALGVRDPRTLLALYAAAYAGCAGLGIVLAVLTGPPSGPPLATPGARQPFWRAGWALLPVEIGQTALLTVPALVLGRFAGPEAVSAFTVANRVSMLASTVVLSVGAAAAPRLAAAWRRGDTDALRTEMRRARVLCLVGCLPLIAVMAAGADLLMGALHAGAIAPLCLRVLLVGQAIYSLWPCRDVLLAMTGRSRSLRDASLVQACLCLVASFMLIPPFGALGAAFATLTIWVFFTAAWSWAAHRHVPQALVSQ